MPQPNKKTAAKSADTSSKRLKSGPNVPNYEARWSDLNYNLISDIFSHLFTIQQLRCRSEVFRPLCVELVAFFSPGDIDMALDLRTNVRSSGLKLNNDKPDDVQSRLGLGTIQVNDPSSAVGPVITPDENLRDSSKPRIEADSSYQSKSVHGMNVEELDYLTQAIDSRPAVPGDYQLVPYNQEKENRKTRKMEETSLSASEEPKQKALRGEDDTVD